MKDNNASFLLMAIGEISESTVAQAKLPLSARTHANALRYMRRPAAIVASILLMTAITAAIILGVSSNRAVTAPPSPTVGELNETVSMELAVKAAMDSLKESGVSAKLLKASLVTDKKQVYYIVELDTEDGTYDCTVDALSGKVTSISYIQSGKVTATEAKMTIAAENDKKSDEAAVSEESAGSPGAEETDISDDASSSRGKTPISRIHDNEKPKVSVNLSEIHEPAGSADYGQYSDLELKIIPKPLSNDSSGSNSSNPFGLSPKQITGPDTSIKWDMNLP